MFSVDIIEHSGNQDKVNGSTPPPPIGADACLGRRRRAPKSEPASQRDGKAFLTPCVRFGAPAASNALWGLCAYL